MHLRFIYCFCAALVTAPGVCPAATMSLAGGRISCQVADALEPIPDDEPAHLSLPPLAVYSTPSRDARMTITRGVHLLPMTIADLPKLKQAMKSGFAARFPDATWQSDELIELNGRQWIHFDFNMTVKEKTVHSALYVTSFDGDQLQLLLQADGVSGARSWAALEGCARTLEVK